MPASPAFAPRRPAHVTRSVKATALAATLVLSLPALAAEPADTEPPATWGLGIGVGTSKNAYKDFDRDSGALPIVQFENEHVRVFGPGVELKLPGWRISESQQLKFSLVGQYDLASGYEVKDSPVFAGMSERKGGFWLGGKLEWENPLATVSAELLGDASGHSKGTMFNLGVERTWRVGQHWMLTPRLVAKWQDNKTVDYYYGVRADEVAAGRPFYQGTSGVSTEVGLRALYMIDRHHSVFVDVGASRLGSSIKDSPLVDRSSENHLLLGYVYRFR